MFGVCWRGGNTCYKQTVYGCLYKDFDYIYYNKALTMHILQTNNISNLKVRL